MVDSLVDSHAKKATSNNNTNKKSAHPTLAEEEEEESIFSLRRLDWSIDSWRGKKRREVVQAAAANHCFFFATTDGHLIRHHETKETAPPQQKDVEEVIDISKKQEDVIKHLFVDPMGSHVIVSLKNGDSYYLHSRSNKPKKISKLQGSIEAVGFDKARVSETSTKSFLVGTSTGRLYEMSFESSGKEKLCNLVHQLEDGSGITSIYFETLSSGEDDVTLPDVQDDMTAASKMVGSSRRIFIMCVTSSPTRLYHFLGGPTCSQLFQDYKTSGESSFIELPGSVERSELLVCKREQALDRKQAFAMLTKMGMYHGSLLLSSTASSSADVIVESGMMNFAHRQHQQRRSPISVVMTDFHFILLYSDALVVQSKISGEIQQEENLFLLLTSGSEDCGDAVMIMRDAERNVLWLVTTNSLFQIEASREDRFAWRLYLEKAVKKQDCSLFDTAHQFCRNESHRKAVHKAQADFFVSTHQTLKGATHLALAGVPFDEVVILLLSLGEEQQATAFNSNTNGKNSNGCNGSAQMVEYDFSNEQTMASLRQYLLEKLKAMPQSAKSQKTMIATWLCELFLHAISSASRLSSAASSSASVGSLVQSVKEFLRKNRGTLDSATTMHLLLSRGPSMRPLLLFYSQIIGDYEKVVSHFIKEGLTGEAISVLRNAPIEKVEELIYKKAPVLIERSPELTVQLFLSKEYLRPTRLLPALFRYSELLDAQYQTSRQPAHRLQSPHTVRLDQDSEGNGVNFAVFYLESYLSRVKERERSGDGFCYIEPSVQHALLWLLAKYDDEKESKLLKLIVPLVDTDRLYGDIHSEASCEECLLDRDSFDISFALRECKREKRWRSCVYLYVLMNFMEKAVQMALSIDLSLAKSIATRYQVYQSQFESGSCEGEDKVGKKLWLLIIEHVLVKMGKGGISQVLQMLHDSNGLLRIEDILQHLPDFTEIDHFKEEICHTLEDYAARIEALKSEMDELSLSAETIDKELSGVTTRGFAMRSHQRCEVCSEALQGITAQLEQFYLFPCGHGYHEACLLRRAEEYLEHASEVQQVRSLQEQISAVSTRAKDADKRSMVQLEHLQAEMDGLIAADCPLCGDYMIRSTGISLLSSAGDPSGLLEEAKSWEL